MSSLEHSNKSADFPAAIDRVVSQPPPDDGPTIEELPEETETKESNPESLKRKS